MRTPDVSKIPLKWLVALGLAVVVISFMVGYLRRPVPLQVHARILFQAILEEDGATILRYLHPVERELNDLTPETTAALVSEMINARYENWGWTPDRAQGMYGAGRFSGDYGQSGRIPGVGRVTRSVHVLRIEGRPAFSLSQMISHYVVEERKWELRRHGRGLEGFNLAEQMRTLDAAMDRDEKRLRELGMHYHGMLSLTTGSIRFICLSDLRTVRRDWLTDPAALDRPDPYEDHPFATRHGKLWMTVEQAREHKRQRAQGR